MGTGTAVGVDDAITAPVIPSIFLRMEDFDTLQVLHSAVLVQCSASAVQCSASAVQCSQGFLAIPPTILSCISPCITIVSLSVVSN